MFYFTCSEKLDWTLAEGCVLTPPSPPCVHP